MAEEDIIVRITGDISGLKDSLNEAKKQVKESGESMSEALKDLKKEFLAAFAFEKIKEFVQEAIGEFAAFERSINTLGNQVKAQGQNWDEMKEKVEDFLRTQGVLYGQTDEQLLPVLNRLYARTHDIAIATKLMDDANKLALLGIGDMASNADLLAQAFNGSGKGVQQLGKALGLSKEQSKDATIVFGELTKKIETVGDVSQDTQSKVNEMSVDWREDLQHIGQVLAPLVDLFHVLEKIVINLTDLIFGFGRIIDDILIGVGKTIYDTAKLLIDVWTNPKQAIKDFFQNSKDNIKNFNAEVLADTDKTNQDIYNTWVKTTKKIDVISDEQLKKDAERNKKRNDDWKASQDKKKKDFEESQKLIDELTRTSNEHQKSEIKSAQQYFDETLRKKERGTKDLFNDLTRVEQQYDIKKYENAKKNIANEDNLIKQAHTKRAKDLLAATLAEDKLYVESTKKKIAANKELEEDSRATAEAMKKFGEDAAKTIGSGFDNMFKLMETGSLTATKAFEELGKAVGAALLQPLIDWLQQQGAASITKGTAELIAGNYVAGAMDESAGALYVGGAAAVKAASSYYLEDGGIVAGGSNTKFVAGDGPNPEAVIPLDKGSLAKYGLGSATIQQMHLHLPEVKNAHDLTNPRTLAKITTTMNRQIGNRQKGL